MSLHVRSWPQVFVAIVAATVAPAFCRAQATTQATPQITDERVVAAMERGVDYLLKSERNNNWESGRRWILDGEHGGETALVLYALLHAGQSLKDQPEYGEKLHFRSPQLAPAVQWLANLKAQETYVASLQACALSLIPQSAEEKTGIQADIRAALLRDHTYLLDAMGPEGGYSYQPLRKLVGRGRPDPLRGIPWPDQDVTPFGDLSNAQYAALGMWALEDAGIPASAQYWETTDKFWRTAQGMNGSWPYHPRQKLVGEERESMGFAGIATLFICQEFVDRQIRAEPAADDAIDRGLTWLNAIFQPDIGDLYSLYGVERVGLATGLKYLGQHDWYREAAANILDHQHPNGSWDQNSWPANTKGFFGATPTTCTCYALLFLARGRNPILFNKLQYGDATSAWDARPRDVAFLTRWIGHRFERPLNWQVVNLQTDPAEWMDAPILVITGSKDPQFTAADFAKLRMFIESGGLIFSSPDGGSAEFTQAMRRDAGRLVDGAYAMRQLPPTHLLYTPELDPAMTGVSPPPLWGLSNGLRELWVHSPVDMAANWQRQNAASAKVHFEVPVALYFYATGKAPLRARLKTLQIAAPTVPPMRKLSVARVMYAGGDADPEPAAWRRLSQLLRTEGDKGLDLSVENARVDALDPSKTPVAHMTGSERFAFKDADVAALKRYLEGGGVLLVDAAGGNTAFADSFRTLVSILYPDGKLQPVPPGDALYTGKFAHGQGQDVSAISFRKYGNEVLKQKIIDPAIDILVVNGQIKVLFSRYDITSGLLGTNTWGIVGYEPASAQALMENMLRRAIDQNGISEK
jgi:hypothetical protein